MSTTNGIIIFDEVSFMRHRMSALFHGYDVQILEAANEIEVYKYMSDNDINVRLILMDLGADVNNGFDILARIKEKKPDLPVIIITANNKRMIFLRSIAEGAADYILKPFEDDYLINKSLAMLMRSKQVNTEPTQLVFDILNYMNVELKKAAKGNYEVTALMCAILDVKNEINTIIDPKYLRAVESFYKTVKESLWETDIFERYGSQTFIGLFPYCDSFHSELICSKLDKIFQTMQEEQPIIAPLKIVLTTMTYPTDIYDPKELLLTLGMKMHDAIDKFKQSEKD